MKSIVPWAGVPGLDKNEPMRKPPSSIPPCFVLQVPAPTSLSDER